MSNAPHPNDTTTIMTEARANVRVLSETTAYIRMLEKRNKALFDKLAAVEKALRTSDHAASFVDTIILARQGISDEQMGWQ